MVYRNTKIINWRQIVVDEEALALVGGGGWWNCVGFYFIYFRKLK